jgi:antitoxin ParD1/3/4/toxin ParE1/3/4
MAKWVLSPLAREELEAILEFVATESGSDDVARRVAGDFVAALDKLAVSPRIGWQRAHLTGASTRWWRVHRYLLVYHPESQPLRVIRILHGARDLERIFRRKE